MKKILLLALVVIVTTAFGCNKASKAPSPKTKADSVAYHIGHMLGSDFRDKVNADSMLTDQFLAGLDTAMACKDIMELSSKGAALHQKMQTITDAKARKVADNQLTGMSIGFQIYNYCEQFKQQYGEIIDKNIMKVAFLEYFQAKEKPDTKVDQDAIQRLAEHFEGKAIENQSKVAADNDKAGREYIERQMKADPTLKKTASGLVYKVIKEGKGAKPTASQTACVRYEGMHISGEVFDNGQGQVQEFPVGRVVPGFAEGLQLMSPGAKYRLYIPGNLGYGESGTPGGPIGPNETLIFQVELVQVK